MVENTKEPVVEPTITETPERHPLHGMMKGYNPNKEYPDDISLMDDAHSKLGELDTYQKDNEAANQKLIDFLDSNEDWKQALSDGINHGLSFRAACARQFDPEDLMAEEGDPDFEQIQSSIEERRAKKAENESFLAEVQANVEKSKEEIEAFCEEKAMDEEARVSFLANVTKTFEDAYKGIVSRDYLATQYVAENHEKEVAAAAENGVIEGKNAAIDEKKAIERENRSGDTLPSITSAAGKVQSPAKIAPKNAANRFLEGTGI